MHVKLLRPIGISVGAALLAQVEGTIVAVSAADRSCAGSNAPAACGLDNAIALVVGMFFAVETLAAALVALVLLQNGKRFGATVAVTALAAALAIEHMWLVT
jgi:hypothetical protein